MGGNRHTIRMTGYDYSTSGYYFVTICAQNRECLFGEIVGEKMVLSTAGKIVEMIWTTLPKRHDVELDEIQVMPNHVHLIINIVGAHHDAPVERGMVSSLAIRESQERAIRESPLHRSSLSKIIGYLKMNSSKMIHATNPNVCVWQRNYYERIIRSEKELNETRRYIRDNPTNWEKDIENPTT